MMAKVIENKSYGELLIYRHSSISAVLGSAVFRFNVVYNSILFSSPLVLLNNLDLHSFRIPLVFYVSSL